ncbi:putative cytochrome [Pseudoalteromonas luteoviolacea B = ATCC 29581]|nr:putative cytochrome [Pseudoalteromonas luteoviolacea B = ATCC 29581]
MDLHFVTGYGVLALLITRLIWGIVGSETAKLSRLVHSPKETISALKGTDNRYGHNAAGSYMIMLFFVLIALQLISGLMTTDDILMEGPLVAYVSSDWIEVAGDIHHANIDFLIAAIVVHVLAVILYRIRGKNLLKSLLTGKTTTQPDQPIPNMKAGWIGYVIFVVLSVTLLMTWGAEPFLALF